MKRVKTAALLLLTLMLWLSLLTGTAQALGGSCGDNVSWSLEEGVLTISGSGDMKDYAQYGNSSTRPPWYSQRESITAVRVEEGVTSVGSCAFYGCSALSSVSLPAGLISIGSNAFDSCYALTELTLPDSVTSIGTSAFDGCLSLTTVNIPDGVTEIGYYTFYHCSSLAELTIPDSVSSIGADAFSGCPLTSLILPEGITEIAGYLCCDCEFLTEITIPGSVTSIGEYAFTNCPALTDVYYGGTSAHWQEITIDSYGNEELCRAEKHFTSWSADFGGSCGDDLTWVLTADGTLTISGSGDMTDVGYGGNGCNAANQKWHSMFGQIKKVVIGSGVTSIYSGAFENCLALESVSLPSSLSVIGNFRNCPSLRSINIPGSVTEIGPYAFANCTALSDVQLHQGLTTIDHHAFYGCTSLSSISLPSSLNSIDYSAFQNCTALKNFTLPSGVRGIYSETFSGCTALTSFTFPSGFEYIDREAFSGCTALKSITIPDTVTGIGNQAFMDCSSLTSVTIPAVTVSVGSQCFKGCIKLKAIYVASGNNYYDSDGGVLLNKDRTRLLCCPAGRTSAYTIPGSVTKIDEYAFAGGAIPAVTIPGSVTTVTKYAFQDCRQLQQVTIHQGVTVIDALAFGYCQSLSQISLPEGLTTIGASAFAYCPSLTRISLPEGLTTIGGYAFEYCSGLEEISIPASITSIGSGAFYGCAALHTVWFGGTGDQWSRLSLNSTNEPLKNATVICADDLAITGQPQDFTGAAGSVIRFTVTAQGDGLTYQWWYSKDGGATFNKSTVSAAKKAAFTMNMADKYDGWKYYCVVTDSQGNTAQSNTVTIHKATLLAITGQPVNYTGQAGSTVRFKVTAQGDGLTYQWWYKKTDAASFVKSTLSSGTKATYTMTLADRHDGWQYYCLVKDAYGNSVRSDTVKINVGTPLKITTQPVNFMGQAGSTIKFTVAAQGDGLAYQWYFKRAAETAFNPSTVSAAKKATFTMTMAQKYDGWQYYCVVSDSHGNSVQTNTVKITAGTPLKITSQPKSYVGAVGGTAAFKVAAQGDNLTYQWYYQTASGTTWSKATATGNTTAALSVPVTTGRDGYKYRCTVKDSHGNSVISNTVKLTIGTPLKITTQPVNYTGAAGSTIKFTVAAQGDGLTYQWWYKKTGATSFTKSTLASGTKATFTMTMADKYDGWKYYCVVTDSHGVTAKTNTVTITKK